MTQPLFLRLGPAALMVAFLVISTSPGLSQEKATFADHVLPLVEQHCAKCHNPDKKKGDLDLTSYNGALKGGGSGSVVVSGNPDSSKLWKAVTHSEEPTMPPNKGKLPDKELAVFKNWIVGGLLETSGSKAIAAARPTVDLTLKVSNLGKPDGPPPMPNELPIEPVVHTTRGNPINGLAASPWAPLVAIAGQKQILLYNTTNLALLGILPFSEGQPWDLKFSRSGKLLLAGGGHGAKSGKVIVWNIETGERLMAIGNEYDTVLAADISPDQTKVALGGPDRLVKIYSTRTGELEHKIKKHTDWVTALGFSPNGEMLATADRNGGVTVWDADNGQELFTTVGHKGAVSAVNWRGDSKVLATSSEDGAVKLWESSEGKQARTWNAHAGGALGIGYTHDGKLVTCGRDGAVIIWSAEGSKLKTCEFFGETALRCAFSHDGARVIAADFAGRVAVWDAKDGKRLGELDANPLPLSEQIAAAQKRIEAIESRGSQPSPALAEAEAAVAGASAELEAARSAADKAKADFAAKAQEVVRLKALATMASPPADIDAQLAAARATREKSRATNNNEAASLEAKGKQLTAAQEKLDQLKKSHNPEAELAAARATYQRLIQAREQAKAFKARDSAPSKEKETKTLQSRPEEKQKQGAKITGDLKAAKDADTKASLKAALKTAQSDLEPADGPLEKAQTVTHSTHWAFQPLVRLSPPETAAPASSAIDAFVSSALAKSGRKLSGTADRRTLIRRLSFDLRGLPPSPDEVAEFLNETRPDAYERLVEKFLRSPRYGERWGRHWLDIVGYADSNGYFSADSDRPLAWKFRDYVVRSINADKPIDRFIHKQIAGDELAGYVAGGDVTPEMVEPLIATHFWRNAPDGTGESDGNPLEVKVDKYAVIEGSVQILGSAFLGLTVQCARCHDHKFEPVSQEEYYGLQAILRPAFNFERWLKPNERVVEVGTRAEREVHQRRTAEIERELKTLKESLEGLTAPFHRQALEENLSQLEASLRKAIQKAIDTKEKERTDAMKSLLKTNAALVDISTEALQKRFPSFAAAAEPIRQSLKKSESQKPSPLERIAVTFEPTNPPPFHHLLVRGNHASEGKEVAPGTPSVFKVSFTPPAVSSSSPHEPTHPLSPSLSPAPSGGEGTRQPASSGRRLALAHWLTSPVNPVVARVLVNRVWHYHFGQGLVSTIDNFGQSGAPPVCPELLDWLAAEFIRSGWSLKHLNQLIVTSDTYRQRSTVEALPGPGVEGLKGSSVAAGESKPRLNVSTLQFLNLGPRRLDAESLRDAMLTVSGEIDLAVGGPYVPTKTDKQGQVVIDEKQAGAWRRSIYLQQRRTHPVDFLSTFDGPAHNPVCVQRVSSTVALQSLSLLNSEFIHRRAQAFARRLMGSAAFRPLQADDDDARRSGLKAALHYAFEVAYIRPPTKDELAAAKEFIRDQNTVYAGQPDASIRVWTDLCQMLLAGNSFLYVD